MGREGRKVESKGFIRAGLSPSLPPHALSLLRVSELLPLLQPPSVSLSISLTLSSLCLHSTLLSVVLVGIFLNIFLLSFLISVSPVSLSSPSFCFYF